MTMPVPPPVLGWTVIYTSKIDNGEGNEVYIPAKVLRTVYTNRPEVFDRWENPPEGAIREWEDEMTVDLVCSGLEADFREYGVTHGPGLGQWRFCEEWFRDTQVAVFAKVDDDG